MRPPAPRTRLGPRVDGPCAFPYAPGPKGGEWRGAASVHTWAGLRMPKWRVEKRGEAIEFRRGPGETSVSPFKVTVIRSTTVGTHEICRGNNNVKMPKVPECRIRRAGRPSRARGLLALLLSCNRPECRSNAKLAIHLTGRIHAIGMRATCWLKACCAGHLHGKAADRLFDHYLGRFNAGARCSAQNFRRSVRKPEQAARCEGTGGAIAAARRRRCRVSRAITCP
jgi:hypothetical protein